MSRIGVRIAFLLFAALLLVGPAATAQTATATAARPSLTQAEIREFLLTAKVIRSQNTSKGVTSPKRLTLTNGTLTHDAAFQAVDERQQVATLAGGGRSTAVEMNFVDAYRYNIAAYELAGLLGLDYMMPVHVERRWDGKKGSLSWWLDVIMDEGERLKRNIQPPNATEWNQQMYRMRVFAALTRDTDRNTGNVLITPQWKVMMIDFTRAFRLQTELLYSKDLAKIDRALLPRLEALTKDSVKGAVKDQLTGPEIDALMARRDVIVAHFKKLIADLGERAVLY